MSPVVAALLAVAVLAASANVCAAQLRRNYYAGVCPDVEAIVRGAVAKKFQQTFITVGATVHLFFHDCFVEVTSKHAIHAPYPYVYVHEPCRHTCQRFVCM